MSPEDDSRRRSAGTLLPMEMRTMSPATTSVEVTLTNELPRITNASDGSRSRIEFIVRFVDQSWKAEKHA
jgi:hypothetical protein